jgi:hypothetical protein
MMMQMRLGLGVIVEQNGRYYLVEEKVNQI